MKTFPILCFYSALLFLVLNCSPNSAPGKKANKDSSIPPPIIEKYADLAPYFNKQNDTTYVINFWATWCKPCVKELPYFEEIHNTFKGKKVKVLLVSLDFPDQIDKKLIPFLKEKQLKSDVIAFIDGDMNSWIPKISKEWSGSIPATVVYKNDQRAFYEQSFDTFDEVNNIIKPFIN